MCYVPHSTSIGDHLRKMVRIIYLMYFVTYWSRINKNYLMKGILVVSIRLTCVRERERKTKRREDISMFLEVNNNVPTKILNWRLRSHRHLRRIKRRRPITTMETWDMSRKCVGRIFLTWKKFDDERSLGIKLLNSSSSLLHKDPFGLLHWIDYSPWHFD